MSTNTELLRPVTQITIRDILTRPLFQHVSLIGNDQSLTRPVSWVHIMEVTEVKELLNGNELILTTGIGWHDDETLSYTFLQQLIESNASGLCIELGTYTSTLPDSMINLAKEHDFPLILFHEEVRYIDITQDLHSFFINHYHYMLKDIENVSTALNECLLNGKGLYALLKEFHRLTSLHVFFVPIQGDSYFFPPLSTKQQQHFINEWINKQSPLPASSILCKPVTILGHHFADLIFYSPGKEITEFNELAADRCATAAAQEVMRTVYIEERKRYEEEAWVHDWLMGSHDEEELTTKLMELHPGVSFTEGSVCVIDKTSIHVNQQSFDSYFIQKSMVARSYFEAKKILFIPAILQNFIVYVLINTAGNSTVSFPQRVYECYKRLQKTEQEGQAKMYEQLAFGKYVTSSKDIQNSFSTAKETLRIQQKIGPMNIPFYENLHIYRSILQMDERGELDDFINEYLEPLLFESPDKSRVLLQTLQTYLSCLGAKQETASSLFIVRQTLYNRLEKIEELLGHDILENPKRLSLEMALYAYEYRFGSFNSTNN
ncbi:PucR family transcriptional regulator [Bacillus sp. FJAT-44742]|uniref:PucR family transcriptional regulator n=1 Tax=Bacillus sp. FJAT-44742 TaxID=2014005 RepID=UPI000C2444E9|nr:PucR family transcriptional regulator [Bacillus sp. FJAT-44742]